MKSWLQDNDTEMYSTHNEGKSVATERFVRTLNSKIYKYRISSNKCQASNKRLLLISASSLISAAPLNVALVRIATIFCK